MYENNHHMHYFDEDTFIQAKSASPLDLSYSMHILEICDKRFI